jgi:hypothetical protein
MVIFLFLEAETVANHIRIRGLFIKKTYNSHTITAVSLFIESHPLRSISASQTNQANTMLFAVLFAFVTSQKHDGSVASGKCPCNRVCLHHAGFLSILWNLNRYAGKYFKNSRFHRQSAEAGLRG